MNLIKLVVLVIVCSVVAQLLGHLPYPWNKMFDFVPWVVYGIGIAKLWYKENPKPLKWEKGDWDTWIEKGHCPLTPGKYIIRNEFYPALHYWIVIVTNDGDVMAPMVNNIVATEHILLYKFK